MSKNLEALGRFFARSGSPSIKALLEAKKLANETGRPQCYKGDGDCTAIAYPDGDLQGEIRKRMRGQSQ